MCKSLLAVNEAVFAERILGDNVTMTRVNQSDIESFDDDSIGLKFYFFTRHSNPRLSVAYRLPKKPKVNFPIPEVNQVIGREELTVI